MNQKGENDAGVTMEGGTHQGEADWQNGNTRSRTREHRQRCNQSEGTMTIGTRYANGVAVNGEGAGTNIARPMGATE